MLRSNGMGLPGGEIPRVFVRVFYSGNMIKQHRGISAMASSDVIF
ncbi:hypothetical protein Pogu_1554 [Pyrobaculum oguniense TE7]|uniref:Uncharacterized protein n=1 Tax=Pyrobaculum oguniense (strain DSM 13380 / JCM 10595 / TE7) TaxID=698757 RepID=H6Q952_PYROT|nr:hypothetical protein Pogu_1554 [Pyrobaculum oguniense TE7]